jgi:alpha-galactosidase
VTEFIEWGNRAITLRLAVEGEVVRIVNLGPTARLAHDIPLHIALNPVELQLAGDQLPQGSRHVGLGGSAALRYDSHAVTTSLESSVLSLVQHYPGRLRVESRWEAFDEIPVIRCSTIVTNDSADPVTMEYLSSFAFNGFVTFANPSWASGTTLAVPHNTFFGEFQWSTHSLPELGILDVGFQPEGEHSSKKRILASSVGTQPTAEYLPMGALTDEARGVTWAWQIEHNGSWAWEIGDHLTGIYLVAAGPNDQEHQWHKRLMPGESFSSVPLAIAASEGGLEEAFAPLTAYRRRIRRPNDDNIALPVVFNDYMNSLLADPSEEKLLPVIAAAACAGAEYFCVDAGWYSDEPGWWNTVGEWTESGARFPRGFAAVFDEIRAMGMIPGLWIEPEVVGIDSSVAGELSESAFFWRNGARVNSAGRHQLDFRSPVVVTRMDDIIDRLIRDYGLGYLKFDYNINGGIGTDRHADSAGDGLLEHNRAFLSWIDGLFERYPELVIEACASGGARVDYATLARHSILSTSDQTDYLAYAPIAASAPTGLTPEQAAIWVYPQHEFTPEEIVFSIVNGMLARPQLSGRIWLLDEQQLAVVAEATQVYKGYRREIPESTPVWPFGLPLWTDDWIVQGLMAPSGVYLAVWRRGGEANIRVPLPTLAGSGASVEVLFPASMPTDAHWDDVSGEVALTLPDAPSARLLRVSARAESSENDAGSNRGGSYPSENE